MAERTVILDGRRYTYREAGDERLAELVATRAGVVIRDARGGPAGGARAALPRGARRALRTVHCAEPRADTGWPLDLALRSASASGAGDAGRLRRDRRRAMGGAARSFLPHARHRDGAQSPPDTGAQTRAGGGHPRRALPRDHGQP